MRGSEPRIRSSSRLAPMGSIPEVLIRELRAQLDLRRAVETGTYRGGGARVLAGIFEDVVTIELSPELYASASVALAELENVRVLQGDSRGRLKEVTTGGVPTFFWLDGHWSGAATGGADDECPLLDELAAIGTGHRDDCLFIDDARLFAASPPPPHDPAQWPSLLDVLDSLRANRPNHHITVLADMIIAVPLRARDAVDRFAHEEQAQPARAARSPRDRLVDGLRRLRAS